MVEAYVALKGILKRPIMKRPSDEKGNGIAHVLMINMMVNQ